MMKIMMSERGGTLFATDDRYWYESFLLNKKKKATQITYFRFPRISIDNGAMIAWTGLLAFRSTGKGADLKDTWCTQR